MLLFLLLACTSPSSDLVPHKIPVRDSADTSAPPEDSGTDTGTPPPVEDPCGFGWEDLFGSKGAPAVPRFPGFRSRARVEGVAEIAHVEPAPRGVHRVPAPPDDDLVMPDYDDDMPLFERGAAWTTETRCYDTPNGEMDLSEDDAWTLFRDLAEATTGVSMDTSDGHRTVLSLRGTYPGTFHWNDNAPDVFNDTLVLLWKEGGTGHVREFPVNTDTGDYDFGTDSSSSLRPNRRYPYVNGWHRSYNALSIDTWGYHVEDDHNTNGHWDSDRNGWLPPFDGEDHDREGSGHNIHMASVDGPLEDARVQSWSAGCQTIPGMANWEAFITQAWEGEGTEVDYFLLDVRDLAPEVWNPCTPDGTHACPFPVDAFPFVDSRDTRTDGSNRFDVYNCSDADESGGEVVYVFTIDDDLTLTASVTVDDGVDVDVHLLEGDDDDACLDRDDTDLSYDLSPGRYVVIADTYVADGTVLSGGYTLHLDVN